MAAPVVEGTPQGTAATTEDLLMGLPADIVSGETLQGFATWPDDSTLPTIDEGYTIISHENNSTAVNSVIFFKIAGASENQPTLSINTGSTETMVSYIWRVSGGDGLTPTFSVNTNSSSTSDIVNFPASTALADALVMRLSYLQTGPSTLDTEPTGLFFNNSFTQRGYKTTATVGAVAADTLAFTENKRNIGWTVVINAPAAGPVVTGPATATSGGATVVTGTDLDTVTTNGLSFREKIGLAGRVNTITVQPGDGLTLTVSPTDTGEHDIRTSGFGSTPVTGVPYNSVDVSAAGITGYTLEWVADDGTDEGVFDVTVSSASTLTTVQLLTTGDDAANTIPGESLAASSIITAEDDMQIIGPKVLNGMTITYNADGTFTTNKDQNETGLFIYYSPSTEQLSIHQLTIGSAGVAPNGYRGMATQNDRIVIVEDDGAISVDSYINAIAFHQSKMMVDSGTLGTIVRIPGGFMANERGALYVAIGGTIAYYYQGVGFTSDGRLVVAT